MALHISIAAEKIGQIAGFPVTNSLMTTWLVMLFLFVLTYVATKKLTMVPSGVQSIAELLVGGLHKFFESITGQNVKSFAPLLLSIFIFVLFANWFGLLPGVGTVGFYTHEGKEFVPFLRAATADLNTTFALSLICVIAIQYWGFKRLGFSYSRKFFNFRNPMDFSLGIMEFISEVSRVISFAFRLFGNIFAGEVLLAVVAFLIPFIVPLPFLMLEIFVGFIQALVFSMLTAVFLNMAVSHGEEH
jgi:F-type H+-transporting ATPase subunit a